MDTGPSTLTTPYLVSIEPNVRFVSVLTAGDSPDVKADGVTPWKMVGIPDGLGAFDNGDGTITVLMNHEIASGGVVREHGSAGAFVSRLVIDKDTLQVTDAQDLAKHVFNYNAATGQYVEGTTTWARFCSGDLADQSAYFNAATGKGTENKIYLTGEENGAEGRAFAFIVTDTDGDGVNEAGRAYELPWMGNLSFENVVASPNGGDKTIVMAMDDSTPGQVYMYVGEKHATGTTIEKAGLTGGQLYGISVPEIGPLTNPVSSPSRETNATSFGDDLASTFSLKAIPDAASKTGAQIETASDAAGVSEFFRPEDGAWDPTHPNWFYFVTTASFTDQSRLYRLEFTDINNPTAGGTIRMLLAGTEGQHMFDNIDVAADGRVVLQEDIGNNPQLGKVWVYDPTTDSLDQVAQHDPARFVAGGAKFLTEDEESSGVIDVTGLLGDADTQAFLLDVQAHYSIPGELYEGGQLLAMYVDAVVSQGTSGADTLNGDFNANTMSGGSNDDLVRGGSGDDLLDGGSGDDTVQGWADKDTVQGGSGHDSLTGDAGGDRLDGGSGNDTLDGGADGDVVLGGSGYDSLAGGAGADSLVGGTGGDTLSGGAGADRFFLESGGGVDRILDFQAGDIVMIARATASLTSQTVMDIDGDGVADDLLAKFSGGISVELINVTHLAAGDWTTGAFV